MLSAYGKISWYISLKPFVSYSDIWLECCLHMVKFHGILVLNCLKPFVSFSDIWLECCLHMVKFHGILVWNCLKPFVTHSEIWLECCLHMMLGIEPSTFVSKIDILTTTPIVNNWCSG